jgi:cytochrome P450
MLTPMSPAELAGIPVQELATCAVPTRWHDGLRSLGTHCRDDTWIVSTPGDVCAALAAPTLSAARPFGDGSLAGALLARMARFSDGAEHQRRRELASRLLPPVPEVARDAGARTSDCLRRRLAVFDIMPMARSLPVQVLAAAMGLAAGKAELAAELTGRLCDAMTPTLQPRAELPQTADEVASELCGLMSGLGLPDEEAIAAAIGILFQARDATAALIGLSVLAGQPQVAGQAARAGRESKSPGQRVEHVLRHDAPVQCTRRSAVADTAISAVVVPAGAQVWIFVAAAERGSAVPATFGAGPHACPGSAHATAIARQVAAVLDAEGWRSAVGQRIDFEPRPNIRVPHRVLVTRR